MCRRVRPCFPQIDLLVRALVSDPATEYVPRFIVFMSTAPNVKGRVLYTNPAFVLPAALSDSYPSDCGAKNCRDKDCGFFDFSACRSLAANRKLVRQDDFPKGMARCNAWLCSVEEPAKGSGHSIFKACKRCLEVLYCCQDHQVRLSMPTFPDQNPINIVSPQKVDWHSHRRVCEKRPTEA